MKVQLDLTDFVGNLPQNAKATVLYTLVGSLNARVIGGAARIVGLVDRKDGDVKLEVVNGFPLTKEDALFRAMTGLGSSNYFNDLLSMNALRVFMNDRLCEAQNVEAILPLSDTLKFMTSGTVRKPNEKLIDALLKVFNADLDEGDPFRMTAEMMNDVFQIDSQMQAARLASISERVLHVAEALPERTEGAGDPFDDLPREVQVRLVNKLRDALVRSRNNVVTSSLRGGSADLGDFPIITASIKEIDKVLRNDASSNTDADDETSPSAPTKTDEKPKSEKRRRIAKQAQTQTQTQTQTQ